MTEQEKPAPLVPPDVDLRGLPFIPLDTVRLLDSDLFALSTGDEFKAAVALWCKSWQQVPASSLPNDDRVLAHLSGAGARWKKVKAMAMRGWILCSDNRWYHKVVAEKVIEAWERRGEFQETVNNKTERQRRWRERQKQLSARLHELGVTPPMGASLRDLESLVVDAERSTLTSTGASTGVSTVDVTETPLTGTGTGTGTYKTLGSKERIGRDTTPAVDLAVALRALGVPDANGTNPVVLGWAERGVTVSQAQEACRIAQQDRQKPRPSVRYLDPIVQELLTGKPAVGASQTAKAVANLQRFKESLG